MGGLGMPTEKSPDFSPVREAAAAAAGARALEGDRGGRCSAWSAWCSPWPGRRSSARHRPDLRRDHRQAAARRASPSSRRSRRPRAAGARHRRGPAARDRPGPGPGIDFARWPGCCSPPRALRRGVAVRLPAGLAAQRHRAAHRLRLREGGRGQAEPAAAALLRPPARGEVLSGSPTTSTTSPQTLQQTLSQLLTSLLTVVGVLA